MLNVGEKRIQKVTHSHPSQHLLRCGRFIPKDWDIVVVEMLEKGENYVIVKFQKFKRKGRE